ncbi:hypothetical protein M2475_000696 [Breznakia sp. PF5-3]|uniref:hypothetical protein n=1 Tax=unclassified Breznakia TaxID=2623764 RepID=UPI0024058298|nr:MULTISPECIES: hypothetical protein [unclassified Breznakia]MDF9824406.1 hypothetical protein [Breznakia sp. PM6-1]MDF9835135.1 hypothetical protein [Breznakia sp. PF5-3]MDL2276146.1 hypothetical protein [Breznakia sp. OttesenSCG-928-G09]
MKKRIGILLVVFGVLFSMTFAYDYFGFGNRIEADTSEVNHMELTLEYAKSEGVEKAIEDKMQTEGKKVIALENVNISNFALNNLHRQYRVETVGIANYMQYQEDQIAENVYIVDVEMKDTKAPIIKGSNVTIAQDGDFDISALKIHAYDVVDGDLDYEVVENPVDTSTAGTYKVVVEAKDANGLKTRKSFTVTVETVNDAGGYVEDTSYQEYTYTPQVVQALDRSNLNVRGWKVVANDSRVSDDVIRSYMNELQNLPGQYNTSHFTTIYIDLSLSYPYLGMAYGDGKIVLNGSGYYATTLLHEATHTYDFARGFSSDSRLQAARNAELGRLPAKFSGNINDDAYEWVANIVVYYYYDPATLRANAPKSYAFVRDVILR